MAVFVLDKHKEPLMPCTEKRARLLLERGLAVVHKRFPFTIRLKQRHGGNLQPVRIKLDPGATTTGVALVREANDGQHVLHLAEIAHRGKAVRKHMLQRAMFRRRRRSANLRYRAPRFDNRPKPKGWLPPSLRSRLDNMTGWVKRYRALAPVVEASIEHVRFDMQLMENPEISGVEYQQGTLAGYELREYLLEKWGRKCTYCDAEGVPLQIEHIHAKARGGSNRVSNLTLACQVCNQAKAATPVDVFLKGRPDKLKRVLAQAKKPLAAAAAVNAVRWALVNAVKALGLPVELASGGRTKWNRNRLAVPKTHCLDAACVGEVAKLHSWRQSMLTIICLGRGSYRRTNVSKFGFPRGYRMRTKCVKGIQTGDMVRACIPSGKKAGTYTGRAAVRRTGNFNIRTSMDLIQGVSFKYCKLVARADGHSYGLATTCPTPPYTKSACPVVRLP